MEADGVQQIRQARDDRLMTLVWMMIRTMVAAELDTRQLLADGRAAGAAGAAAPHAAGAGRGRGAGRGGRGRGGRGRGVGVPPPPPPPPPALAAGADEAETASTMLWSDEEPPQLEHASPDADAAGDMLQEMLNMLEPNPGVDPDVE